MNEGGGHAPHPTPQLLRRAGVAKPCLSGEDPLAMLALALPPKLGAFAAEAG